MKYLTAKQIMALNQKILDKLEHYPSRFQSDVKEALEEIIDRARSGNDASTIAATYLYELNRRHVFSSANKRTAFLASEAFLRENGIKFNISDEQAASLSKDVRNGKYTFEELRDYIEKNTSHGATA
ncbi:MAG: type II toxin-antitoxin system death-on-curing family toxin [Candidatus Micrarchaeota archaeon]|nr:type II toxin-antitoxin system death-on-curing family toxin [Candidatus Micrarchaeota archaeon]MDE1849735.1 type II toxin-antitoxin system death-on-curing family toxin [Candidatus Micrarchaeota archaeon]